MKMNVLIKELRKGKGLTQEQVSELVGVSLQTVRRWEWGETMPNSKLLSDLAKVLDTTPERLLDSNTEEDSRSEKTLYPILKNTGTALVYERNGERMELPPTKEGYEIFREIAARMTASPVPVA